MTDVTSDISGHYNYAWKSHNAVGGGVNDLPTTANAGQDAVLAQVRLFESTDCSHG